MTIEARINLQRGVPENKLYPATDYTSDGSFLDQYILARVHYMNYYRQKKERLILDPAAYNALIDQTAKDIITAVDTLFKNSR